MAAKPTHSLLYQLAGSILIILLLALAFWFFYIRPMQPPASAYTIENMRFTSARSKPVENRTLPDDWLITSPGTGSGWYTSRIDADVFSGGDLPAIYIPVIHMHAEVFVNDVLVGRTVPIAGSDQQIDPLARDIYRPLYVSFSKTVLNPGDNKLQLRVTAFQPGGGLIGPLYAGDDSYLRPYYHNRLAARVTTVQIISASMLTIAIFMTVLWWLRRQDSLYGWFALLVYTWTARNLLMLGIDTPLPSGVEDWLALVLLGWFIVFMMICTHRYMEIQARRAETIIFVLAAVGSLALAVSYTWQLQPLLMHRIWSSFSLLLGSYALGQVALAYRYRDDLKNPFVPAGGLSILLLGSHDWLLIMGLLPRDAGLLLHFSAPVTLITFASLLLERFAGVLREAESLNVELESRVAEKHDELEANYRKLREMENRQILAEERERFMKEMHDGVGGHLIAMLSMMRSGEKDTAKITRAIEATLSDLRIMIDSLDPSEHDIPALLGAMRSRLEPQLASIGMRFEWQVNEIPPIPDFGPRKALQVMRIIQEAITNVLNHADASLIRIHARVETDATGKRSAVVDVIDDGKGFAQQANRGHGLDNMEYRANAIDASLDIHAANPGTCVRLTLPYAA